MAAEDSHKKMKKRKHTKKNIEQNSVKENSQLPESVDNFYKGNKDKKNKKKYSEEKGDTKTVGLSIIKDESDAPGGGKKKEKKLRAEKKKNGKIARAEVYDVGTPCNDEGQDEFSDKKETSNEAGECKMQKSMKKKQKNTKTLDVSEVHKLDNEDEDAAVQKNGSKKARKIKKKDRLLVNQSSQENSVEKKGEAEEYEVFEISSGDEDSSKGMKKWITEYHQSRPGIKVLQERIDDFIAAHEAQEEQARREREAKAAEGGWTVVVHHKGRKKTSDAESGTVVGSVAQAAVLDKMAKRKNKDAGPDFYRFQRREAHRNEIMMLQSKFEQDKKRIQQMRAERKFRPY
ncbi:RRP7 domain-containing protein [Abeliophyllum distichum]|uniref:RRP7 domain-containing protein n=1 Tax=Abeliophyllum distichum TaxID=126358 RepID=A0ABD1SJE6_9LAMI